MPSTRTIAALLLLTIALPAAAEGPATAAFQLRDGVVVDPARSMLYLMAPEGAVEGVGIALGEVRWLSAGAARPLVVTGDRLVAQAETDVVGELPLVLLDAAGGRLLAEATAPLPAGVPAVVDDGLGSSFSVRGRVVDGDTILWWSFIRRTVRGAVPEAAEETEAVSLDGAVRVDGTAGSVRTLPPGEVPEEPDPPPPDLPPGQRLAGVAGRQFRSADRRHVLGSERVADERTWAKHRWTLYDRANGARVGRVDSPVSYAPFFVAEGRLIVESRPALRRAADGGRLEEPLAIRAVDLVTGTELWRRPLRDTAYRGPLPP